MNDAMPANPFPGLRPFESWETEIFFGRESHTDRLLEILKAQNFLAVIGPSGSGKSSLVRAGLLPALPLGAIGTGSDWRIVILRPGDRPLHSLAMALRSSFPPLGERPESAGTLPVHEPLSDIPLFEAELHRGPLGLTHLVHDLRHNVHSAECNVLVLVDQN